MKNGSAALSGQVAIVTGASKGIGRASALKLAEAGANVIAVARSAGPLRELADEIAGLGVECIPVVGDVAHEDVALEAIRQAKDRFGRLDILVNNAGIGSYADFLEYDAAAYDEIMDTNMRSTFLFTRHAVPLMKEQGSGLILQIASQAGLRGFTQEAVYCASKHAQIGFTHALRLELQPFGIKVSAICPAGVKTEFAIGKGRTEEFVANSGFLEAEDVAETVLLIACQSPGSRVTQVSMIGLAEAL